MTDIGSDLETVLISGFPMLGKKKKKEMLYKWNISY